MASKREKFTPETARRFERYSVANAAVLAASLPCGCEPYVDVFTYVRWKAQGFQVQRGEKAIRLPLLKQVLRTDPETGEETVRRMFGRSAVFCRHQVKACESKPSRSRSHSLGNCRTCGGYGSLAGGRQCRPCDGTGSVPAPGGGAPVTREEHNGRHGADRQPSDPVYCHTLGYGELSQYDPDCSSCWLGHRHTWEKHDRSIGAARRERLRLVIEAACKAEELFELDELEGFVESLRRVKR